MESQTPKRPFPSQATRDTARGRGCATGSGAEDAKWVFLSAADAPDLQIVNGGKFPKIEPLERDGLLDHVRVRTEFYFEPTLAAYPFQIQRLPVTLELDSDVLTEDPPRLLCLLEPYSGFAPRMSSFSAAENDAKTLSAAARVDEAPRRPPYARGCTGQLDFPRAPDADCAPTTATSRLSLVVEYVAPRTLGAMVLLPPALIALGSLVSYALDDPSHRLQVRATAPDRHAPKTRLARSNRRSFRLVFLETEWSLLLRRSPGRLWDSISLTGDPFHVGTMV